MGKKARGFFLQSFLIPTGAQRAHFCPERAAGGDARDDTPAVAPECPDGVAFKRQDPVHAPIRDATRTE